MNLNQAGLDLIKTFEGWRADAYPDPGTGGEPITIGFGHTSAAGSPKVTLGMKITQAEGEAILLKDLQGVIGQVKTLVSVPLNDNQFSALVSFAFNVGVGNLKSSTLLRLLNAGEYGQAAGEFGKWNHASGKIMAGLTRRRAAEQALFVTSPLGNSPIAKPIPFPPLPKPIPATPPTPSAGGLAGLLTLILNIILALFGKAPK